MNVIDHGPLGELLSSKEEAVLKAWIAHQGAQGSLRAGAAETQRQSAAFLAAFRQALQRGAGSDINHAAWQDVKRLLAELSASRARLGATSSETATFVFSLKQALFGLFREQFVEQPERLADETWHATQLLDRLGLYTVEVYQKSREEIIVRQQQELLELTTPVVQLWDNIIALPLIGTLDSSRTQVVMENLLQKIVDTGSSIAIIDITGVPTVDTLVAQHLLKTVAAARLMGADCIISGIRPQIAQTIVHLGVDLSEVTTKASLADAFTVALARSGSSLQIARRPE
jgi:rsbT co-antagonist protein RsbR